MAHVLLLPLSAALLVSPAPRATCRSRGACMSALDADMFRQYANPESFEDSARKIVEFPNPILRSTNTEILEFDEELAKLCAEFFRIMYAANGVGIAAPQVGLNQQLFVYNVNPGAPGALRTMGEIVVVNPKIVEYSETTDVEVEGCLSSRSECCVGDIRRASEVRVEYQDARGRLRKKKLRGFEARVFQHEFDHLQGILHIDRQSSSDRKRIQPFLDALVEMHGPGGALDPPPEVAARLQPEPGIAAPSVEQSRPQRRQPGAKVGAAPRATKAGGVSAASAGFGNAVAAKRAGKAKKKRK